MDSLNTLIVGVGGSPGWLVVAHHVSTIVVAIAALVGLLSLVFAQREMVIRSRRESVILAAEICERWADRLIEECGNNLLDLGRKIKIQDWGLSNHHFRPGSLVQESDASEWIKQVHETNSLNEVARVANRLEGFAVYFTSGAADEEIAFSSMGPLFCGWIRNLSPFLVLARSQSKETLTSGSYESVVRLYDLWARRMTKSQLEEAASRTGAELEALGDVSAIKPIGT